MFSPRLKIYETKNCIGEHPLRGYITYNDVWQELNQLSERNEGSSVQLPKDYQYLDGAGH